MLYLLFQIGKDRYAIEACQAVEVLPFVDLEKIPQAVSAPSAPSPRPRGVAGIFNYRGQPVVAMDLCELTLGRPARELLSTRIIVLRCQLQEGQGVGAEYQPANPRDTSHLAPRTFSHLAPVFGLIVERATGMMRREARDFASSGLKAGEAPHFGPVVMDDQGVIQLLQPEHLLTDSVRAVILPETAGGAQAPSRRAR